MESQQRIYSFMMLVGDSLLRSGASSASTTRTLLAIARAEKLEHVTVSVTLGQLTLSDSDGPDGKPFTEIAEVSPGVLDIGWRTSTQSIISDYLMGAKSLQEAYDTLNEHVEKQSAQHWAMVSLGYAILGGGFSLLLGASLPIALGAIISSLVVSTSFQSLSNFRLPGIFRFAIAGAISVLISSAYCMSIGETDVSVCIVSSIAGQLAGIAAYDATQDAMMGWYISATGRYMEAMMSTGGLVTGVGLGIGFVQFFEQDLAFFKHLSSDSTPLQQALIGAFLVTGGFALACGGRGIKLLSLASLGLGAVGIHSFLGTLPLSDYTVILGAAIFIGALSVIISKPMNLTSNAVMMLALLPLIPGMMIYQGMLGTIFAEIGSVPVLAEAAILFYCLSVGGTTGQYIFSELMWLVRKSQFSRKYPGIPYSKIMVDEYNAQDIMLPVFSRPFNRNDHSTREDGSVLSA